MASLTATGSFLQLARLLVAALSLVFWGDMTTVASAAGGEPSVLKSAVGESAPGRLVVGQSAILQHVVGQHVVGAAEETSATARNILLVSGGSSESHQGASQAELEDESAFLRGALEQAAPAASCVLKACVFLEDQGDSALFLGCHVVRLSIFRPAARAPPPSARAS